MEESRSWKIYKEIQQTVKRISYEFNLEMLVFTEDVWIKKSLILWFTDFEKVRFKVLTPFLKKNRRKKLTVWAI